jgi:hypothetical protein
MLYYKYYKFPNKESVPRAQWPANISVHEVGIIRNNDGKYDVYGNVIEEPSNKEGWFVNICHRDGVDLSFVEEYRVNVKTPNCLWAGQEV